ncbi:hypothetical protein EAJ17_10745 [Akkermansia sp. aa_0143]|nr:hypothetical protein EAJ17_10745 [Akkermansia sp. aa_0143]
MKAASSGYWTTPLSGTESSPQSHAHPSGRLSCPDSRFLVFFCVECIIPPFEKSISHWKHKFPQHPLFPRPTGLKREPVVS